jgi:ATP-binding cassette subfamily B protein
MKVMTDMQEVINIFDTPVDIVDPKGPERLKIGQGHVVFKNVSFSYKDGNLILQNFNLDIAPGERIGLVGHSGAGKSTITKLLLRFVDITAGSIVIDGQNIKNITQNDLRSVVSYVPQESILFHRTIRENIAYGRPEATDEEIEDVAKKSFAHDFIIRFPKGYDTLVGERGIKLSGGERQRIAIARAMLKNSPILVLDEATSSLDSVSEKYIQDGFEELMKGKTTIVIAHRLSTISKMDKIVVLENGNIVEIGSHKELLEQGGVYAGLWNHQSGGFLEN